MNHESKKVLITGGSGFIGYHLAKRLADLNYDVVLTDNFFRSKVDKDLEELLARPNVKLIEADLTNISEWDKLGSGYDYVYHLAAVNGTKLFYEIPHEVMRVNLTTALNAVEWFRSKNSEGKILFTSSNELYAGAREAFNTLQIPTPETVPAVISDISNPRWSYASTKLIGEQLFIHYSNNYKFRMSIVRPHNFYGPRAGYHHVIPEFIMRYLKKTDPFPIYGEQDKRSFCYIDDAVEAMQLVMESDKTDGQTYHIGSDEEYKMRGLAEAIFTTFGWRPEKVDYQGSPAGSVNRRLPDISKIKRDTGWVPKTKLTDGIKKTMDWYKNNPEIKHG